MTRIPKSSLSRTVTEVVAEPPDASHRQSPGSVTTRTVTVQLSGIDRARPIGAVTRSPTSPAPPITPPRRLSTPAPPTTTLAERLAPLVVASAHHTAAAFWSMAGEWVNDPHGQFKKGALLKRADHLGQAQAHTTQAQARGAITEPAQIQNGADTLEYTLSLVAQNAVPITTVGVAARTLGPPGAFLAIQALGTAFNINHQHQTTGQANPYQAAAGALSTAVVQVAAGSALMRAGPLGWLGWGAIGGLAAVGGQELSTLGFTTLPGTEAHWGRAAFDSALMGALLGPLASISRPVSYRPAPYVTIEPPLQLGRSAAPKPPQQLTNVIDLPREAWHRVPEPGSPSAGQSGVPARVHQRQSSSTESSVVVRPSVIVNNLSRKVFWPHAMSIHKDPEFGHGSLENPGGVADDKPSKSRKAKPNEPQASGQPTPSQLLNALALGMPLKQYARTIEGVRGPGRSKTTDPSRVARALLQADPEVLQELAKQIEHQEFGKTNPYRTTDRTLYLRAKALLNNNRGSIDDLLAWMNSLSGQGESAGQSIRALIKDPGQWAMGRPHVRQVKADPFAVEAIHGPAFLVLEAMAQGRSLEALAPQLGITLESAEKHAHKIFETLGVYSLKDLSRRYPDGLKQLAKVVAQVRKSRLSGQEITATHIDRLPASHLPVLADLVAGKSRPQIQVDRHLQDSSLTTYIHTIYKTLGIVPRLDVTFLEMLRARYVGDLDADLASRLPATANTTMPPGAYANLLGNQRSISLRPLSATTNTKGGSLNSSDSFTSAVERIKGTRFRVLEKMIESKTPDQIAQALRISLKKTREHVSAIYKVLAVYLPSELEKTFPGSMPHLARLVADVKRQRLLSGPPITVAMLSTLSNTKLLILGDLVAGKRRSQISVPLTPLSLEIEIGRLYKKLGVNFIPGIDRLEALRARYQGKNLAADLARIMPTPRPSGPIPAEHLDLLSSKNLRLLADLFVGKDLLSIAEARGLSVKTVSADLTEIRATLGIKNILEDLRSRFDGDIETELKKRIARLPPS